MNAQMMDKIKGLSLQASQMASEILEQKPCLLHAALNMMDDGQTVRLAGNSEGLVYLASLLLSLAVEQSNNQQGLARILGGFGIIDANPVKEDIWPSRFSSRMNRRSLWRCRRSRRIEPCSGR